MRTVIALAWLPPIQCDAPTEESGEATYYDFADDSGNCGFPPSPGDLMVAAINTPQYAGSAACGSCAHVVGPRGEVTVRIVDGCPECPSGDMSERAIESEPAPSSPERAQRAPGIRASSAWARRYTSAGASYSCASLRQSR